MKATEIISKEIAEETAPNEVQSQLIEIVCISHHEMKMLCFETAFNFIEKLTEIHGLDMSYLVTLPMFWNIWHRKWKETDLLFINRIEQKPVNQSYRIRDNAVQPPDCGVNSLDSRFKASYGDYLMPFYYKEKFDGEEEVIIFSISEMVYHYKTLHECEQVMTWAMASLVNLYRIARYEN
jgi:hypothetical protein